METSHPRPTDDPFAVALPPVPYPGLRPFELAEWPIFFGRETMAAEVVDRLLDLRMLMVHGDSGCGKSSLVRAGVQAQLEQEQARSGHRWVTAAMRPGESPLWAMAAALGQGGDQERVRDLRRILNRGGDAALALDGSLGLTEGARLCLLVDQFEELFRFAKTDSEEAHLFTDVLVGLANRPPQGLYLILTMRSEFLGHCARYEGFAEAVNRAQYLLPRMDRPGLVRAIREPAKLYRGDIDPALADVLISDAGGGQDGFPLIQHGLLRLWLAAGGSPAASPPSAPRLGLADYGAGGGLAALLSAHADAVLEQAASDGERQRWAEHLFRALTDINADGHAVRRPRPFAEFASVTGAPPEALRGIIDAFRAEGVSFLTPYGAAPIADGVRIDLGHEALIRCWLRIADRQTGWLQREFKDGRTWQTLRVLAETFQDAPDKTLSPAATLDLTTWIKTLPSAAWTTRYGGGYEQVQRFIAASEATLRREEAEAAEQQRLAQNQQVLEVRQRVRGRWLALAVGLALVAVGLAAFGLWAAFQAEAARQDEAAQRRLAERKGDDLTQKALMTGLIIAALGPQTKVAAVSPNGQWLASIDGEGRLSLLNLVDGKPFAVTSDCARLDPTLAVFSPDSARLAMASGGDTWLLDPARGLCTRLPVGDQAKGAGGDGSAPRVRRVAFSPDGRLLASGGDGGICRIWQIGTTTPVLVKSLACRGSVVYMAFDPAGERLICKDAEGGVLEWQSVAGDFSKARKVAATDAAAMAQRAPLPTASPPPRLYVHIQSEDDRLAAKAWQALLEASDVVVPGIEMVGPRSPRRSELRFFRQTEAEQAQHGLALLKRAGLAVALTYVPGYEDSNKIRPRHFELWLAEGAIGYWFPVVASITDREAALAQARSLQKKVPNYLVQVFAGTDAKGKTMYAVTLGGYLTESEARSRVDFARKAIDPSAYAWQSRTWGDNLLSRDTGELVLWRPKELIMAYLPADRYDYDIFISFSHRDNGLLPGQDPREGGWVERFARFLEVWLRDRRGLNGLKVWLDKGHLSGATQIDNRIQGDLGRTGLLLVLHSRNYRESSYCEQELGWFLDAAARQPAGLAVNNERRVFNVLINNIQHREWSQGGHWTRPLGGTLGFRFHDAAEDDTQSFGDPVDPSDHAVYRAAMKPIVDAAYRLLSGFPREAKVEAPAPSPTGPLVFLADCPEAQSRLRKRLIQEIGPRARITPAVPPPYPSAEHDRAVAAALANADLSIHLLDELPGRDMDDTDASYPRRQADLALAGQRRALFWLPEGLSLDAVEDPDHRGWLQGLEAAPRGSGGYQVLRGSPERLIADVLEQIAGIAQIPMVDQGARTLVVDPHLVDQLEGLELGFRLKEQARSAAPNLSLLFTRDGTEPEERWDDFERLVIRAHDLVVLFGRVTPQWVKRRVERAFKVAATHLGDSPSLRNIWVLLLPDCRGREALPPLPPLIRVRVLDNTASPRIADATLVPLLSGGDRP